MEPPSLSLTQGGGWRCLATGLDHHLEVSLPPAETWVPFREISSDDVARAALLVSGARISISLLTEAFVPFALMKSVMDETARREKLKEQVRLTSAQTFH